MAIKKYYDSDCNLGVLDGKTVAVIGFGSQAPLKSLGFLREKCGVPFFGRERRRTKSFCFYFRVTAAM